MFPLEVLIRIVWGEKMDTETEGLYGQVNLVLNPNPRSHLSLCSSETRPVPDTRQALREQKAVDGT